VTAVISRAAPLKSLLLLLLLTLILKPLLVPERETRSTHSLKF
jgi:hypothetical protein